MKVLAIFVVLMSCQQLFAAKHASFKEFKKVQADHTNDKLADLKAKLAKEFEGAPGMVIPEFIKTKNFGEMKARMNKRPKNTLPDFGARKATLKELRAKLEDIRKTATTMDKPSNAFFEEVKKTLAESMDPRVAPFELPELTTADLEAQVVKTKTVSAEPHRFLENFGEDLMEQHEEVYVAHTNLLDDTGRARGYMVDQVFNVFGPMVFELARGTQELMRMRNAGQDLLDSEEAAGADPDCIAEFREEFRTINYYFGNQLNICARYAYYPANRYLRQIFYPYLDYVVNEVNALHYLVLNMMVRANLARDQESFIGVVDVVTQAELLRGDMFAAEVLTWEGNAFADAHIYYIQHMNECGNDLVDRYTIGYNFVINQYEECRD